MEKENKSGSRVVFWVILGVILFMVLVIGVNIKLNSVPMDGSAVSNSASQQSSGSSNSPSSSVVQVKGIDQDNITKFCDGSTLIYTASDLGDRDNSLDSQVQANSPQCVTDTSVGGSSSPMPPRYPDNVTQIKAVSDTTGVLYKVLKFCDGANLMYVTLEEYGAISLQLMLESATCKV